MTANWQGGPLPFRADAITSCSDKRGCIHWIYLQGNVLKHRIRGSRDPYPISDEDTIGNGYAGLGSVFLFGDGRFQLEWPKKNDNAWHLYIIPEEYPDPSAGQIVQLDDDLTVPSMFSKFGRPIFIQPFLIPSAYIDLEANEDLVNDRQLNRAVILKAMNADRAFSLGVWERDTLEKVCFPYVRVNGGKFDLNTWNEAYWQMIERRVKARVDRRITAIITLTDNCSTHDYPDSHWALHPWNGNNNINGTSNWNGSVYHFYEEDKQSLPGIPESAYHIERFIREIVKRLDKYRPYVAWEIANEAHGGYNYHAMIRQWLREGGVAEDWRVQTSFDSGYEEWYAEKAIYAFAKYSGHSIQIYHDYQSFKERYMPEGVSFIVSEDGLEPYEDNPTYYESYVLSILQDKTLGVEVNERPDYHGNSWNPDDWNWDIVSAVARGWARFLEF